MAKHSYHEIKARLQETVANGLEPELTLHMNGKVYMIIGYDDHVSFQRCRTPNEAGGGEVRYNTLDALYNAETVDSILLMRDWEAIEDFECFDFELFYKENF